MTHHDETFLPRPAHLVFVPGAGGGPEEVEDLRLMVHGQGTFGFLLTEMEPFTVTVGAPEQWGSPALRWAVGCEGATLHERTAGQWRQIPVTVGPESGLDADPGCPYWFSVDAHNRALLYGKGEMRLTCALAKHQLPPAPKQGPDPYAWLAAATTLHVSPPVARTADVWRDPVTVEPPMKIVPVDEITMEAMATGAATVAANLSAECQVLYANVAGERFALDTPDFPDFSAAIEASIATKGRWCYETLADKATEFGSKDPLKTYLRITMGANQGDSPGIPFVMEIWPSGHYSPIHNHGGADAVIKVLHGAIHVSLFRMLSPHHTEPYTTADFGTGDVTWISPRLNQTHQLKNNGQASCITIQCYQSAQSDDTHYPYFDYLEAAGIGHFDPSSDLDFLKFKKKMREEHGGAPARP